MLADIIRNNISKLPRDIDLVVGVPRSGMIPAYIIGLFMNKPVCSLNEFTHNLIPYNGERKLTFYNNNVQTKNKILIVDDSILSGNALNKTKIILDKFKDNNIFVYCCIFATKKSKQNTDYYFEIVESPRIFQ